jgi:toxin ParE1/3/4
VTIARREHRAAREELFAAAYWYDSQRSGLGDDLLDAVDAAIEGLFEWPNAAPPLTGWDRDPIVRTKGVQDFPYRIIFFNRNEELIILAYAHERRDPGYWTSRLGDAADLPE